MGTIIKIKSNGTKTVQEATDHPTLEFLQFAVNSGKRHSLIEKIPLWDKYEGKDCIAFCNEEGKIFDVPLPVNQQATNEWIRDLAAQNVPPFDVLLGDVIILVGDRKFLGYGDEDEEEQDVSLLRASEDFGFPV